MTKPPDQPLAPTSPAPAVLEYASSGLSLDARAAMERDAMAISGSATMLGAFTLSLGCLVSVCAVALAAHTGGTTWMLATVPCAWTIAGIVLIQACPEQRIHYPPAVCVTVIVSALIAMAPFAIVMLATIAAGFLTPCVFVVTPIAGFFVWSGVRTIFLCGRYWSLSLRGVRA